MAKTPSPCIDVCKFKLDGHCIGCGMTKKCKKSFKKIGGHKRRLAFFAELIERQARLGIKTRGWQKGYRKRCARKGADCLLDDMPDAA